MHLMRAGVAKCADSQLISARILEHCCCTVSVVEERVASQAQLVHMGSGNPYNQH